MDGLRDGFPSHSEQRGIGSAPSVEGRPGIGFSALWPRLMSETPHCRARRRTPEKRIVWRAGPLGAKRRVSLESAGHIGACRSNACNRVRGMRTLTEGNPAQEIDPGRDHLSVRA